MVGEADIYGAGMPHPEINKWSCLPPGVRERQKITEILSNSAQAHKLVEIKRRKLAENRPHMHDTARSRCVPSLVNTVASR